jgi:putative MATE family efflux protein
MTGSDNPYTRDAIAATFMATALPIVFLVSANGLLTVVDGIFLGAFVGPDALNAVTIAFPISMFLIALSSMVSIGMASVLGRLLGAGRLDDARRLFAGAHGLSLGISVALMALFASFGGPVTAGLANSPELARMAHAFLTISIYASPLQFLVSVHADALRTEGRIRFIAIVGLSLTFANMALNAMLIGWFGFGISGSAWSTACAQAVALTLIFQYRLRGKARLTLAFGDAAYWRSGWRDMLALGAPRSLSFIGVALSATAIILSLRRFGGPNTDASIVAFGIINRLMAFAYFPLLGISLAMQAIISNNAGANLWARTNATLKLVLIVTFAYACIVEIAFIFFRHALGGLFVDDPGVISEIGIILPIFVALYLSFGPMMMIANYFQSIGDARLAALLSLSRTYLFAIPLTLLLPFAAGQIGIWLAVPLADVFQLAVTFAVLTARSRRAKWGLFRYS